MMEHFWMIEYFWLISLGTLALIWVIYFLVKLKKDE